MHVYIPKIEGVTPDYPERQPSTDRTVRYAFELIPIGGSGLFDRTHFTVRKQLYSFMRTPEGQGMRFRYRPVTKHQTRVWRIK